MSSNVGIKVGLNKAKTCKKNKNKKIKLTFLHEQRFY
jgi:hypothetical protein